MAEHAYEYRLMALYLSPQKGALPDYTAPNTQASLTSELGKTASNLNRILATMPDGEGWNVNSHSLTFIGGTVVLSILLQRSRT